MKKIIALCLVLLATISTIYMLPSQAKAENQIDLNCQANSNPPREVHVGGGEYSQVFYPRMNRLSQVGIEVGGPELPAPGFSGVATWKIIGPTGAELSSGTRPFENLNGRGMYWQINSFPPDYGMLAVTPGQPYKFQLSTTASLYWYESHECNSDPSNGMDPGYLIADGGQYPQSDYGFTTWGMNVAEQGTQPNQPSTPSTPATTTTTTTTTTGSQEAPATQTTASIKAPTAPKAENVAGAATPTVKISWTKSTTTDITGYKIFRSTAQKTGFKEVGQVDKALAEFSDATVAANTKYYYFVRAYKTTSQSPSSATVNVTTEAAAVAPIPTPATEEKPAATTTTTTAKKVAPNVPVVEEQSTNWVHISLITLLLILIGLLAYLYLKSKKEKKKIPPKLLWPIVASIGMILVLFLVLSWVSKDNTAQKDKNATKSLKSTPTKKNVVYYPQTRRLGSL